MIRFYHGKILTMDPSSPEGMEIHDNYEVWVEGTEIVYVGRNVDAPARVPEPAPLEKEYTYASSNWHTFQFDREIDLKGNLLMPGFKNAHTHSPMTFLRSYADDLPLQEWLNDKIFPMEEKLTPQKIYHATKLAVLEYLTSGITASFDMYIEPEANARANADLGFRTVLCGTVNDFKDSVADLESFYHRFNRFHPLVSYQLGFHAEYTCSKALLCEIADLAKTLKAPVYGHVSETKREVDECMARYGVSPVKALAELGIWNYGGGGFHFVHLSREDVEIMKRYGLSAVTNPASNLKLASGIAPVSTLLDAGIEVAIGTDGPASNNCLDMFREMFLVSGLAKYRSGDAAACPAAKVLSMATVAGAHVMGLDQCDCIAAGKQADLIVIDLNQPNMQPQNHIIENLVYSGSKQNVKMTMVAGRILYEDGKFNVGEDPAAIYEAVAKDWE